MRNTELINVRVGCDEVYPSEQHGDDQVDHRDPHREVQTGHEDARDAGVRALRDTRVRYEDNESTN